jgi:hypothetical protein
MADYTDPFAPGSPRPPDYFPLHHPQLMQNPMSALVVSMFGNQLMQGIAGPGKFFPNLSPGQQLGDQILGSIHQRAGMANIAAANRAGNADVARRVVGMMTMVTGQEAAPLTEAQAAQIGSVLNNPVMKMALGSLIGADALEAAYFGRKGDPAALAAIVNRVGFSRRDSLGGTRMTSESMQDFTQSLHAELYGTKDSVDDMHGFMAGQTGQLFENLFQRGLLPRSVGALTPAERVNVIGKDSKRDDETMNRLARQLAMRELSESDRKFTVGTGADRKEYKFSEMTEEQQEDILKNELPGARTRIDRTMARVDAVRNRDGRFGKPEEFEKEIRALEELPEYGVAARGLDASKAAQKVKDFTGAVAAVREIFGDNGNPNAPMSQLLAALDHLSQGSISQVGPGKVENVLRSMRQAARDTGVGFEQLAGMSAEIGAYGDTLGIARPISMQNTLNALVMTKAMRDQGKFDTPLFGKMDQATASREVAMRMTRGDASGVGMAMAALRRAVELTPDEFKGTQLEAVVNAYKNGSATYDFGGQTYNFAEFVGKRGALGVVEIAGQHGITPQTMNALARDPATQQFLNAGYAFLAQPYQLERDLNNLIARPELSNRVGSEQARAAFNAATGAKTPKEQARIIENIGATITKRTLNETLDKTEQERNDILFKNLEADVAAALGGGKDAERQAKLLVPLMFGESEEERRRTLVTMTARMNTETKSRTGRELTATGQIYDRAVSEQFLKDRAAYEERAARLENMSRGMESSLIQRISEGVAAVGGTGKFDRDKFFQDITGVVEVAGLTEKLTPELIAGVSSAAAAMDAAKNDKEESARLENYINAVHRGDSKVMLQASAEALAKKTIKEKGLAADSDNAKKLTAAYVATIDGTTASLEKIEAMKTRGDISGESYTQLKGLWGAAFAAEQGLVLGSAEAATALRDAETAIETKKRDLRAAEHVGGQAAPVPSGAQARPAQSAAKPKAQSSRSLWPGSWTAPWHLLEEEEAAAENNVAATGGGAPSRAALLGAQGTPTAPNAGAVALTAQSVTITGATLAMTTTAANEKPEMTLSGNLQVVGLDQIYIAAMGRQFMQTPTGAGVATS